MDKPIDTSHVANREDEIGLMNRVRAIIERNYKEDIV